MPRYLRIAEKVYKKIQKDKGFMDDPSIDLRLLLAEIRKEIQGSELKLLYNYIDFETLMMSSEESKVKLDLSIIPKSKNSQEFILWLAGFTERITTGGKQELPPLLPQIDLPQYVYEETSILKNSEDKYKSI